MFSIGGIIYRILDRNKLKDLPDVVKNLINWQKSVAMFATKGDQMPSKL